MESINETGVQQRNQNMQSSSQTILGYQIIVGRISKRWVYPTNIRNINIKTYCTDRNWLGMTTMFIIFIKLYYKWLSWSLPALIAAWNGLTTGKSAVVSPMAQLW